MRAYVAARVLKGGNGGIEAATRHAVSDWVWWAMNPRPADAECGAVGALDVGDWVADDPRNCGRCARRVSLAAGQHADAAVPVLG